MLRECGECGVSLHDTLTDDEAARADPAVVRAAAKGRRVLCSAYADDMAILVRSQHAMDVALQRCQQWADRRFVRFSPKKTKLMRLAQGNEATRATTALAGSLYGVALEVVDSFV